MLQQYSGCRCIPTHAQSHAIVPSRTSFPLPSPFPPIHPCSSPLSLNFHVLLRPTSEKKPARTRAAPPESRLAARRAVQRSEYTSGQGTPRVYSSLNKSKGGPSTGQGQGIIQRPQSWAHDTRLACECFKIFANLRIYVTLKKQDYHSR